MVFGEKGRKWSCDLTVDDCPNVLFEGKLEVTGHMESPQSLWQLGPWSKVYHLPTLHPSSSPDKATVSSVCNHLYASMCVHRIYIISFPPFFNCLERIAFLLDGGVIYLYLMSDVSCIIWSIESQPYETRLSTVGLSHMRWNFYITPPFSAIH